MITQNAINLLKNRIKNNISSISNEMVDKLVNNLFNTENKYLDIMATIQEKTIEMIKSIIVSTFKEIDNDYCLSQERKKYYWINRSNVSRTITTIVGDITYSRNYYQLKYSNDYIFYIDELFGIPAYDHYDPIIKGLAISKAFDTNMSISGLETGSIYTNIKDLTVNEKIKRIPRQSVQNWIKEWKNPNEKPNQVDNTPDTLYIMGDEKFIGCQDLTDDIMVKAFVSFEGVETISKGRRALINKTNFSVVSTKAWQELGDYLAQKYDFSKINNIVIIGDGGSWIKSGISEMKLEPCNIVKYLLCEFHFKQAINHITTDSIIRKEIYNTFTTKTKNEFKEYMEKYIEKHSERKETIEKKVNYILNNYNYIKAMLDSNIGSSMESHISHNICTLFASRPKGYSSKNISQYLKINDLKLNGYNLFNMYLKSYQNKENITLNEEDLNLSVFENTNSSILPVINSGKITPIYNYLKSITNIYNSI